MSGTEVKLDPAVLETAAADYGSIAQQLESAVEAAYSALSGTGAMAGEAELGETFALDGANGYDKYATDNLQAPLAVAGVLYALESAIINTARTYEAAQKPGAFEQPTVTPAPTTTPVTTGSVPSAYGESGNALPFDLGEFGDLIQYGLDQVGVKLPSGDPDALQQAEDAWRELASALTSAKSSIGGLHPVAGMTLPQQADIDGATTSTQTMLGDMATSVGDLQTMVGNYKEQLKQAKATIQQFIEQMLIEIAIEAGLTVLLSIATGGLGAIAGAGKIVTTIVRWVNKIKNVIDKLRDLLKSLSSALRIRNAKYLTGAVKQGVIGSIASGASTITMNVVHSGDQYYQQQNVGMAFLTGGVSSAVSSPVTRLIGGGSGPITRAVTGVSPGSTFGSVARTTAGDVAGGAAGEVAADAIDGGEFNPLNSAIAGALMGGVMSVGGSTMGSLPHGASAEGLTLSLLSRYGITPPGGSDGASPSLNAGDNAAGSAGDIASRTPTPAGDTQTPTVDAGGGDGDNSAGSADDIASRTPTPAGDTQTPTVDAGGAGTSTDYDGPTGTGGTAATTTAGGGGASSTDYDGPTPGGSTGGSTTAGGGGAGTSDYDGPTPGGGDAGASGGDGGSVDVSNDAPTASDSLPDSSTDAPAADTGADGPAADTGSSADNGTGAEASAADQGSTTDTDAPSQPDADPTSSSDVDPTSNSDVDPTSNSDAEPAATNNDVDPTSNSDVDPAANSDVDPTSSSDVDPTSSSDVDPTANSDVDPAATTDGDTATQSEPDVPTQPEADPAGQADADPTSSTDGQNTAPQAADAQGADPSNADGPQAAHDATPGAAAAGAAVAAGNQPSDIDMPDGAQLDSLGDRVLDDTQADIATQNDADGTDDADPGAVDPTETTAPEQGDLDAVGDEMTDAAQADPTDAVADATQGRPDVLADGADTASDSEPAVADAQNADAQNADGQGADGQDADTQEGEISAEDAGAAAATAAGAAGLVATPKLVPGMTPGAQTTPGNGPGAASDTGNGTDPSTTDPASTEGKPDQGDDSADSDQDTTQDGQSNDQPAERHPDSPSPEDTPQQIRDKIDQALTQSNTNFDPYDLENGFATNCGNVSSNMNDFLNGSPIVDAETGTLTISEMEARTGLPQTAATPEQIEASLRAQGPGAHVVVGVDRGFNEDGHWFNAVFDGETVWSVDGQNGTRTPWPPHEPNATFWDASIEPSQVVNPDGTPAYPEPTTPTDGDADPDGDVAPSVDAATGSDAQTGTPDRAGVTQAGTPGSSYDTAASDRMTGRDDARVDEGDGTNGHRLVDQPRIYGDTSYASTPRPTPAEVLARPEVQAALNSEPPTLIYDNGVLQTADTQEIIFTCSNENHDIAEMLRQARLQEMGINRMPIGEIQQNAADYQTRREETGNGRADKAEQAAYADEVRGTHNAPFGNGHVLHGPDQVAGGDAQNFDGVGDGGINSSLGNQWGSGNADALQADLAAALDDIPADLAQWVHPSVEIRVIDVRP